VGATSLAALRALPAESLLKATGRPGRGRFSATIDGWFLPDTPANILAAGKQAQVPLLVGWNSEESGWKALLGDREPTPENYASALRALFGANGDEALRLFPVATTEQVLESATFLAGARFIAYSTWKWAELHRGNGRDVYRYLYAHPRPAAKDPVQNPPHTGAVHSSEIEYALGNLATNQVYNWTPEDFALSDLMGTYFANFVKTGDPNGAGLPSWPAAYSDVSARVMVLDIRSRAEPALHEDAFRFLERFYRAGRDRVLRR